jgi:hypothetical protein
MESRSMIQWVLIAMLVVLFFITATMTWNYRAMTTAAERANRLCGAIQPGTPAEDVVAQVEASEGARLTASADEVSADFGRCLCFVPIASGKATAGIQVGCQF